MCQLCKKDVTQAKGSMEVIMFLGESYFGRSVDSLSPLQQEV